MTKIKFIEQGASADIFDIGENKILKAYYRRSHTDDMVTNWHDHDALSEAYFRVEAKVYELLQTISKIEKYIPRFYGLTDPVKLLNNVTNNNHKYLKGCGILLEYIPGQAEKVSRLPIDIKEKAEVILEEISASINGLHVWDASFFTPGTRSLFTLIDFGTWEGFAEYQIALNEEGTLSEELRTSLSNEWAT